MGKKGLDTLLSRTGEAPGGVSPAGGRDPVTVAGAGGDSVETTTQQQGLLDPIMSGFDDEEKFTFMTTIVDFLGDSLVSMIDHYHLELAKVENAMSVLQGTVMNQVSTIRNQVSLARQQGLLTTQKPPAFTMPGQFPVAAPLDEPPKRREATEKDVMDIAASIRQLVSRQKGAKEPATPALAATTRADLAAPERVSIDSKVAQYQQSSKAQKDRVTAMTKTPGPATPRAADTAPAKEGLKIPSKPAPTKDFLPTGFHDELMKNIKSLMKEKGKERKED